MVCGDYGICDTTYVYLTILPPTDTVYDTTSINDTLLICVDTSELTVPIDTSFDCGGTLSSSQGGTLITSDSNCLLYIPPVDYVGSDTFCFVICDTQGICDTTKYIIEVLCDLQASIATFDPTTCAGTEGYFRIFIDTNKGLADYNATVYPFGGGSIAYGPFSTDTFDLTGLSAGSYDSVVITDANGCSYTLDAGYSLTDPSPPLIDTVIMVSGSGCGVCDGRLLVVLDSLNAGNDPYDITYDSP